MSGFFPTALRLLPTDERCHQQEARVHEGSAGGVGSGLELRGSESPGGEGHSARQREQPGAGHPNHGHADQGEWTPRLRSMNVTSYRTAAAAAVAAAEEKRGFDANPSVRAFFTPEPMLPCVSSPWQFQEKTGQK